MGAPHRLLASTQEPSPATPGSVPMSDAAIPSSTHADGTTRRDFLDLVTWSTLAVGAGALAWPLINQMNPSADVLALSSVEVDLAPIGEGAAVTIKWRGKPVFIRHRTAEEISEADAVPLGELRDPQTDAERATKPEWLVIVGVCTHLGCVPLGNKPGEPQGRLQWLVLPVPWLALRHGGPHPQGAGAAQPGRAGICLPDGHQRPHRLTRQTRHPRRDIRRGHDTEGYHGGRRSRPRLQERRPALDRRPAAAGHLGLQGVRGLSGAEEPELFLELRLARRHHADAADRDRHRAGDALHAAHVDWRSIPSSTSCATSTTAGSCATPTPTAPRCSSSWSTSTSSAASITAPTRRRASCCGCWAWSSCS